MSGRVWWLTSLVMLSVGGCATLNSDRKVQEAIDLVEQHTGHQPAWTVPWDEAAPAWDGQSVLRLDEAVALALRNNRDLRADLETIGQADAELVQAGLLQNPRFNFMMMFPDGGGRSMLRSSALPMQPLQDLWLIPARQEVARAELQQAVLRVADRAIETAAAVKKAYTHLQYTQRAVELIRDNMQVVDQSTRIIEIRQVSGQAGQVEVNLSRIRHMRLQSDLLAMEAEHRARQRELLMLMGLAAASDEWQVEPVHEIDDALTGPVDETGLLSLATSQRLDLQAAEWTVEAATRRIELMRREGWPELALGFTFERAPGPRSRNLGIPGRLGNAAAQGVANGLAGMPPETSVPMAGPFGVTRRDVTYTLGPMIEMELPLFDQNQAQVAKALHEYRRSLAEYEARVQEVTRMVRETSVMNGQAYEQVRFYRESILPAVERNLSVARQAFIAGQEDLTIYLQVQEDLIMTRLKILEFLRDYLVGRAELERQVGGRLAIDD